MKKKSLHELGRLSVEAFKAQDPTPIVLVLDNIRSGLNVGSAFRTADAFALQKIYLCGITAKPPHREIMKTAIGATQSIEWAYFEKTTDALRELRQQGFRILAVEQTHQSIPLHEADPLSGEKIALIFGNEVRGVSDEALEMAEASLEIPQFGTKHSLNISVCLGIVVWEFFKNRKWPK
ncbi:MAG: TrmH family RNA methyltransferase [Bacteroidetes bacterium]|nr:MAG: TrmH family RNA methyltransferase [Bacteroidota bacterium]